MMNRARPTVHLLASLAAALWAGACSDDTPILGCPAGMVMDATGTCVARGGRGDDTGTGDVGGTDATDTGDPNDSSRTSCEPEERFCVDGTTAATCDASGTAWTVRPCSDGLVCDVGDCVAPPETCEPGAVIGCESPTERRVCGGDGLPRVEACPDATPNCEDGECTDRICSPNARRCEGTEIVACSADGRSEDMVQICEFGCAGGRCVDPCSGESKDYLGCTFWAADLDNHAGSGADIADFGITISNAGSREVNVTIETGDGAEVTSTVIGPDALETIVVAPRNVDDTNVTFNTFKITSDAPITVHQFNPLNNVGVFSNDASLLLPATSVGTDYVVVGWPTTGGGTLKSFVAVIAVAEGETEVAVTSPIAAVAGGPVLALQPGVEQRVRLQQGQILSYTTTDTSARGFTGMEISATQPVAVFSGSECAFVPVDNNYCDHLEQQLFPVDTWGTEFVGAKFAPRGEEPDVWRVVVAENGTTVRTTPSIPIIDGRTLGRGEYVEFVTEQDFVLTADRPVSLAQFMVGSSYPGPSNGCGRDGLNDYTWGCLIPRTCGGSTGIGDPAFLVDVPTAQFREDYIVLTPNSYEQDYFTFVARPGTAISVDGVEVTGTRTTVGGWQILRYAAPDGVHKVHADAPIGLYAYGYDCDVSYAYPGGLNLESLR